MEKTGVRLFAYLAVVLMLVSILPAGAIAASENAKINDIKSISGSNGNGNQANDGSDEGDSDDNTTGILDRDRDRDRDMVSATEDATRKRTESMNAASDYQTAKNNFANIRSKNPNLNTEEAIEATRTYLISSIDYMTSLLDDDEYIDALNEERDNVEAATTRQELADSAKNIRTIWDDARKDRIISSGKVIDNKINAVIKTSDALIVRLENEIDTIKENGEDVEYLETMLAEYKDLMDNVKENQEQARNVYMEGNGNNGQNIREANRYLVQAGKDIKDANAILRNMLKELKQQRKGVVVLTGNGTLTAEGNGTAVISGDVDIDLSATDGKLVIKDLAGDAVINVDGAEYEYSNIDSGNSTDNNRAFVFMDLTGDVYIEGSRLTVMLQGSDIEFTVNGTGTAVLSGEGTYDVDGEDGEWASRYIDDDSEDEEESEDTSEEETEEEDDSTSEDVNATSI